MEEICKKFTYKAQINQNLNNYSFLYSGTQINLLLTFSETISSIDRARNIMSVLVYDVNTSTIIRNPKIIKPAFPICKKCDENMKFELEGYKIRCSGCKNGHSIDMLLNEYEDFQKIDISKIKCDECAINKYKAFNNQMYICNTCKKKLCPL